MAVLEKDLNRRLNNLVSLRDNAVQKVFNSFLSMHEKNSERTANEYKIRVEEFFKLTIDKETRFITLEDIQSIKKSDVQTSFIDELSKKGNSNNTIRTKLNSVRSFYNELLANDLKVNPMIFKVKLPVEVNHHDALTEEELEKLYDFMKNEKELGTEKYLAVKTLFITANRKTATLNMTWKDSFTKQLDIDTGREIHVITIKDKGNKLIQKPISDEFYNELQVLNKGQEKVFSLNPKTLERALQRFSKTIDKKITPHSMKATSITLSYRKHKDIELSRQLGGHSSIKTTEMYIREEKSLINQLSYSMGAELDDSILDNLTHDELLDFIRSNEDIKNAIILRLRKS